MLKKELMIVVLLLTSIGVWAQRDYRKGYIITNELDTTYGWIDYRGDIRNAKLCSFKKTETDQATEYAPLDIAAYRYIDSKYYVSRNIGTVDAPKHIFLEYLVNGMASLYYYRSDAANDHYYIEMDEQFLELKIDEKEVDVEVARGIVFKETKKINSYVGILKATLNVWEMSHKIDNARLDHASLIDIAKDYHQHVCTDGSECIVYEKKKPFIAMRVGPVIGVDLSTFKMLKMNEFGNNEMCNYDQFANLSIGVNLNFSMPRLNEKLFLQMQAMYTKYYFFETRKTASSVADVHFRSNALQMGLAVKYEYPKGKIRPTLAVGASFVYMPDGKVEEIIDFYQQDAVRSLTKKSELSAKLMYGFEVVPGIHYHIAKERIIFMQLQYLRCYNRKSFNLSANNTIQSFGLSAGIYF